MKWPTWRDVLPSFVAALLFLVALYAFFRPVAESAAAAAVAPVAVELSALGKAVALNGARLDRIEERLDRMDSRIGARLDRIEERLDRVLEALR